VEGFSKKQIMVAGTARMPAMPFSPSDLSWWGWLLVSFGAWIVCVIAANLIESSKGGGCLATLVAVASGITGAITGVMGVILFVKWVWTS
jgi:hypothetical protein